MDYSPFFVPEEVIKRSKPDVVFRLSERGNSLRATVKYRSAGRKIIEKLEGTHYLKKEKAYSVAVEQLSNALKYLRDNETSFAVEQKTAEQLSHTAALRAKIISREHNPSAEELHQCALAPFVDLFEAEDYSIRFKFQSYTREQIELCIPKPREFTRRPQMARNLSESELLSLLLDAKRNNVHVWLTANTKDYLSERTTKYQQEISKRSDNFPEHLLAATLPAAFWMADNSNKDSSPSGAEIYVSAEQYEQDFKGKKGNPFAKKKPKSPSRFSSHVCFGFEDSEVLAARQSIQEFLNARSLSPIPSSALVTKLCRELEHREQLRQHTAKYQRLSDFSFPEDIPLKSKYSERLFPHQRVAVAWLLETPRALLGDDMGLGKTLAVLSYFWTLREGEKSDFALVICPNSLVRNWLRECANWFPELQFCMLPTTKSERQHTLERMKDTAAAGLDGIVLNYETMRLDTVFPVVREILEQRKALLILDESQRVKNPTSKSFKAIRTLAEKTSRRVLLSGTPTPKDVSDIWSQMLLLDDGQRFGSNYYQWLAKVAVLGNRWSEFAITRFRKEKVKEAILRVQEILLRRKKEDVLDLPEKLFSVRDCELQGEQAKRYEEVRKDLLVRIRSLDGDIFVKELDNLLEQYLRAVQISANPRLVDPLWEGTPAKFQELDSIVQELVAEQNKKLVIWTNYLGNVDELSERYKTHGTAQITGRQNASERQKIVQDFQKADNPKVLIAIPAAGGVGLTLTAAQTAVYLDFTWNAEHWLQSIDRIHRIGQEGTVNIISLRSSKVDELIAKNLERKRLNQAELLGDENVSAQQLQPTREELLNAVLKSPSAA